MSSVAQGDTIGWSALGQAFLSQAMVHNFLFLLFSAYCSCIWLAFLDIMIWRNKDSTSSDFWGRKREEIFFPFQCCFTWYISKKVPVQHLGLNYPNKVFQYYSSRNIGFWEGTRVTALWWSTSLLGNWQKGIIFQRDTSKTRTVFSASVKIDDEYGKVILTIFIPDVPSPYAL